MELKEISKDIFNKFASSFMLSSIYQTSAYGEVMENQNCETIYVGMYDDGNNVVAASLILVEKLSKFKYAYAPRGFLIDYTNYELLEQFTNAIKKFLKKRNIMAIKICPLIAKSKYDPNTTATTNNPSYDKIFENLKKLKYYHLGYNHFFEALKPRFVAIAPLEKNTKEMFNKLHESFKEKITSADLAGIRIYKGNESHIDLIVEQMRDQNDTSKTFATDMYKCFSKAGLIDIYFAQLETKTFLVNTQVEYQKQVNVCNSFNDELFKNQGNASGELINRKIAEDNKLASLKNQLIYATNLLRTYPNGIAIATAMVIKYRGQVYLTLDGYDQQYKHLCARHLLIWKLMEKFAQEGYKEFNLGGITNPTMQDDSKYKGTTDFKINFNAFAIEYAGDFELVTSYPLYTLYRNTSPIRRILKK